jgi:hypothetical protein
MNQRLSARHFAISFAAIAAFLAMPRPAAADFFQIVDQHGTSIVQGSASPWPQASFSVDGCEPVVEEADLVSDCSPAFLTGPATATLTGIFVTVIGGGRGCSSEGPPFAVNTCFSYDQNTNPGSSLNPLGAGNIYSFTAAPTAPGGLVFEGWTIAFGNPDGSTTFDGVPVGCAGGNSSLECTFTSPDVAAYGAEYENLIFPILTYGDITTVPEPSGIVLGVTMMGFIAAGIRVQRRRHSSFRNSLG